MYKAIAVTIISLLTAHTNAMNEATITKQRGRFLIQSRPLRMPSKLTQQLVSNIERAHQNENIRLNAQFKTPLAHPKPHKPHERPRSQYCAVLRQVIYINKPENIEQKEDCPLVTRLIDSIEKEEKELDAILEDFVSMDVPEIDPEQFETIQIPNDLNCDAAFERLGNTPAL